MKVNAQKVLLFISFILSATSSCVTLPKIATVCLCWGGGGGGGGGKRERERERRVDGITELANCLVGLEYERED